MKKASLGVCAVTLALALAACGKSIPLHVTVIGTDGRIVE